VVDQAGDPVKNARVRVVVPGIPEFLLMFSPGASPGREFSAADGSFAVPMPGTMGPPGMAMEIVASHPAYAEGRIELGDTGRGAAAPADVRIVLSTGSSIAGRVMDPGGQPISGAQIRVKRPVRLEGETVASRASWSTPRVIPWRAWRSSRFSTSRSSRETEPTASPSR
jgi:hypothetical protein